MKKHRYLRKIIITYSCITYCFVLFVLLASVGYIQLKNIRIIKQQEENLFKNHVSAYENLYEDMFNISNDIRQMTSLDLFALSDEKNYYVTMTRLQQELSKYSQQYQRNGYGIMVHLLNDNKMITQESTIDKQYYLPSVGLKSSQYGELLNELIRYHKKDLLLFTDKRLIYIENKNYLDHDIIVMINCPLQRIALPPEDQESFSISIDDSKVKDLRTRQSEFQPPEGSGGYTYGTVYQTKLDNRLCLQTVSRYYGIVYSSLSPDPLYSSLYSVLIYLLLILLLAFVPIFLLITSVSKVIFRPIRELISTVSNEEDKKLPDANEMDFLLGKVRTIQRQNQELIETAGAHRRLREQNTLIKLLNSSYSQVSIRRTLKDNGISWLDAPCTLIIFDTPLSAQKNSPEQYSQEQLTDILRTFFLDGRTCICIELAGKGVCCVMPAEDPVSLQTELHEALLNIESSIGWTFSAYIPPESKGLETLSTSYNIAVFMQEEHGRLPLKNIYVYRDYEKLFETSVGYPFSIERDLINAVGEYDWDSIEKIIDEIFDIYISKTFHEKSLREMNTISLINTINRSMQKASLDAGDLLLNNQYLLLELKMASSPDELRQKVKGVYQTILSLCEKKQKIRSEDLNNRLQDYICHHYSEDFSLNDMADWFGLSPNYMSLVFKNIMDCNFKEYLTRFRCEKAKELLLTQPGLKISEVAAMVGVQNVNTFIRVFKKECGVSPGQYQAEKGKIH